MSSLFCRIGLFITVTVLPAVLYAAEPATQPELQPNFPKATAGVSLLPSKDTSAAPTAPPVRVGVLDINTVSTESVAGKAAQTQLKALQAKLQKQIETKRKQLDKLKAETERQMPTLNPLQREAKSKEFQKKIEEFQKFGMGAEKELAAAQEKQTRALFDLIGQVAYEMGKERGLAAIVIHKELLFLGAGVERVDLTADLIKLANEKGAKK